MSKTDGGHSLGYRSKANHLKPSDGVARAARRDRVLCSRRLAFRAQRFQAALCARTSLNHEQDGRRASAGLPQQSNHLKPFGGVAWVASSCLHGGNGRGFAANHSVCGPECLSPRFKRVFNPSRKSAGSRQKGSRRSNFGSLHASQACRHRRRPRSLRG